VIVGGPGPAKEDFLKMSPFNYQIKILGMVNAGYTDEYGVREVLTKSDDVLAEQEMVKEKKIIDNFIKDAVTGGLVTYGEDDVRRAIISKQASTLLISEGMTLKRVKLVCESCGIEKWVTVKEDAPPQSNVPCQCGGSMKEAERIDLIDDLVDLANASGITVEIISIDTPEGVQFQRSLYGIGAILRYR